MKNFTFTLIDGLGIVTTTTTTVAASSLSAAKRIARQRASLKGFDPDAVSVILSKTFSSWSDSSLDWRGQG